ncbi:ABC transporter substrate-binding protein [Halomonas sp. BM-2019]|uniref:ABC transporter substrate-binding protein n=1 Tax=Halomonas sp. BM-2019 TaxID=2811227 RepID=UPI001B3C361C|nr:MAG: ABC transporter substrate-binding protein [Halomonas sp. BM-2019]
MKATDDVRRAMAPQGVLRTTINLGNPILAGRDPETTRPHGISVDLATRIAERLGVELELLVFDSAGQAVAAVDAGQADMGFFARDPERGQGIDFTPPYVLIEGCYLVPDASPITDMTEVDRPGNRVVVGKGSAYDLFLSRAIQHAEIQRSSTSPAVVAYFLEHELEVAAGVKQQLEAGIEEYGGMRLLPGRFMTIEQAMGVPKGRDPLAREFLAAFIEEVKSEGVVAELMARHGIEGATVAPQA